MLTSLLEYVHNALTLFFGVFASAAFLGIRLHRKNLLCLSAFSLATGVLSLASFWIFGAERTEQLYPLLIHLPLILLFVFGYRFKLPYAILSTCTAYLACQVSNWIGILCLHLTEAEWVYYTVRILITLLTCCLFLHYVPPISAYLLQKPTGAIMALSVLPIVYYVFDYLTSVYTGLLYTGTAVVSEFLGFVLCFAFLLFLFLYFRQYESNRETEEKNRLLELQKAEAQRRLSGIRRAEETVSHLRHDMRHFLAQLFTMLENGQSAQAAEYVRSLLGETERGAPKRYCENETVNLILSAQIPVLHEAGIQLQHDLQIPGTLPFTETEMTSVLCNALENAMHAVRQLPEEQRVIRLKMHMQGEKLLLSMENPTETVPLFRDGMPLSAESGHGIGTQSIRLVTERAGGHCRFFVRGNVFVLQIIV